jgi:hypothetical protein
MSMQETYVPNATFADRRFRCLMGLCDHIECETSNPEDRVAEREAALLESREGQ